MRANNARIVFLACSGFSPTVWSMSVKVKCALLIRTTKIELRTQSFLPGPVDTHTHAQTNHHHDAAKQAGWLVGCWLSSFHDRPNHWPPRVQQKKKVSCARVRTRRTHTHTHTLAFVGYDAATAPARHHHGSGGDGGGVQFPPAPPAAAARASWLFLSGDVSAQLGDCGAGGPALDSIDSGDPSPPPGNTHISPPSWIPALLRVECRSGLGSPSLASSGHAPRGGGLLAFPIVLEGRY
jgi:hypothetical protein